jgi:hypothetical protein
MKKLFQVCLFQELIVYAEDIEEAKELFTENIDEDGAQFNHFVAMEVSSVPPEWRDALPYVFDDGNDDERTCAEILAQQRV